MPHQCLKCGHLFQNGSTTILRGCPECRGTRFFFTEEGLGADERRRLLQGSEVTLREAIEQLVQKAKEGAVAAEADGWILAGPEPAKIVTDEAPDLPEKPIPHLPSRVTVIEDAQPPAKVVVKLPKRLGRLKGKRPPVQFDYAPTEPAAIAPEPPPLFSHEGLKDPVPPPPAPVEAPAADPLPAPEPAKVEPPSPPVLIQSRLPEATAPPIQAEPEVGERPETIRIQAPGEYEIDVKRLLEDSPVVVQKDGTYLIHLPSLFEAGRARR